MAQTFRPRDLALLGILAAIWGTAFLFISIGLQRFSPLLLAAYRFDISGLFLFALMFLRRRGPLVPRGGRAWTAIILAGVLMTAAYNAFLFWGQQTTTPSVAAVIVGLSPVLTVVFSRALLHDDRVGLHGLIGLVLGFIGVLILASLKGGRFLDARGVGELAVVVAIGCWALGSVLVKRQKHGLDVFTFTAWQTLVGAIVLHIAAFTLEPHPRAEWDRVGLEALLYLAIISSGIGFLMYFTLVEHVGPIRVNLVSYIAPVFATLAGFVVLHQQPELRAVLAFILIATGFFLVVRKSRVPRPSLQPEDAGRVAP